MKKVCFVMFLMLSALGTNFVVYSEETSTECYTCDYWFPFNCECQYTSVGESHTGVRYELVNTVWNDAAACHDGESNLPFSKTYTYTTPATQKKYSLLPDSVTVGIAAGWFNLSGTWNTDTISSAISESTTEQCNTVGCCLTPLNIYNKYEYVQKFEKRQIHAYSSLSSHHGEYVWKDCIPHTYRSATLLTFNTPVLTHSTFDEYDPKQLTTP